MDEDPRQQVFMGAAMGQIDALRAGAAAGADLDAPFDSGNTPLTEAILGGMGEPEAVEVLVELGADPSRADANGWTPWLACMSRIGDRVVEEEQQAIREILEQAGASREGESLLEIGERAFAGDVDRVRTLLDDGVPPDSPVVCALSCAVGAGQYEVAELLLERGATPEGAEVEETGETCLMRAASKGYFDLIKLLVRHGADVQRGLPDAPEWTAIEFARGEGHDEIADWLAQQAGDDDGGIPAEAREGGPKARFAELYRQHVSGINHGLDTDAIVERLMRWDAQLGIHVPEVSHNSLTVQFDRRPDDLDAFAAEVEAFCPDIVDQGFGALAETLEAHADSGKPLPDDIKLVEGLDPDAPDFGRRALARWIQQHQAVQLWWD